VSEVYSLDANCSFFILDCRFRLAELQFIAIQKLDSPGSIEQGLRRLPHGITKMYDYFLQEQGEKKLATLRILQMVLYSPRRVSAVEVAEILGVDALYSEKPVFKPDLRPKSPTQAVLNRCIGFVSSSLSNG
jgi:hypothetical protein